MGGVAIVGDLGAYKEKPIRVIYLVPGSSPQRFESLNGTLHEVSDQGVHVRVSLPPDNEVMYKFQPFLGSDGSAIFEIRSQDNNEKLFFNPLAPSYADAFRAINKLSNDLNKMSEELRGTFSLASFGCYNILKKEFGDLTGKAE